MKPQFEQIIQSEKPVVIEFYRTHCEPCKYQSQVMEEVADKLEGEAEFYKIDVNVAVALAASYGVKSAPTVVIFKKGEEVFRYSEGVLPPGKLEAYIRQQLENSDEGNE